MPILKTILLTATILMAFISCQQEMEEIKLPSPAQAFTEGSATANLLQRLSLQDGSADNMLDSASCLTLVMPITVIVNGQSIVINNEEDLKYIERTVDESDEDIDELTIIFPITVKLANHTEVLVSTEDALEAIAEHCEEGGIDDDIECIDVQYPISLSVYNIKNEIASVVVIKNDQELHHFIEAMEKEQLVSLVFPLVLINSDGSETVVMNNDQLNLAIEAAITNCDEDDDSDFDDDDVDTSGFTAQLLDGTWTVDLLFDETDQTNDFIGYSLQFMADGTAKASNTSTLIPGTWSVYGDDGNLEFILDFGEAEPWSALREEWIIKSTTATLLELNDGEDEQSAKRLVLKKN